MRIIWKVLKVIFGAFALLLVIGLGLVSYEIFRVRADTNHSRESFGIGNSIYEFWVPEGRLIIIRFSSKSKSEYCLTASLYGNSNVLTIELPNRQNKSQEFDNRQNLPSTLQMYRENIRECDTIDMTVMGRATPYRGSFSVYFSDEKVTGSKEPYFWD